MAKKHRGNQLSKIPPVKLLPRLSRRQLAGAFGFHPKSEPKLFIAVNKIYREIDKRTAAAGGKFDKYNVKFGKVRCITMATLKVFFPERFDTQVEVIKHLEHRLKAYDEKVAVLTQDLAREKSISRQRDELLAKEIEKIRTEMKKQASAA